MARRINELDHSSEKGKIRLVIAEVEANNQTLQDLLRTMAPMLGRPAPVSPPPKRLAKSEDGVAIISAPAEPTLFDHVDSLDTEEESTIVEQTADVGSGAPRRKRGDGPKADRNAGLDLVPDLDFVPEGKMALKAFFAQKTPRNDLEQMLVLAHYLQHTLKLQPYGPAHILTAFKHVNKPVPADLRATIRNMKSKKNWLNFTDPSNLRVTTEGNNFVDHEMPRAGSKGETGAK